MGMCRLKTHGSLCTRSSPFTNWGNTAALGIALIHIWWFQVPGLVCDTDMAWLDAQKRLMGNYQDGGWSGYPVLTIAIKKKHYLWYLRYQYCAKNSSLVCAWIPEKGEKSILQWFCLLLFSKMFPHTCNSQNQPSDVTDSSQMSGK